MRRGFILAVITALAAGAGTCPDAAASTRIVAREKARLGRAKANPRRSLPRRRSRVTTHQHGRLVTPPAAGPAQHPLSTYRLQLTPSFTFEKARETLPYLHRLGIKTIYLSPVLQARPGSQHGYDVANPAEINAELGGRTGFRALVKEAARLDLGLVIDVVPNHMGVSSENRLWEDVLTHGTASRFARYFDIDWGPSGRRKLVLPVLGDQPSKVAAQGELSLSFERSGAFRVRYFDKSFPLSPSSIGSILAATGDRASQPRALRSLVDQLTNLGRSKDHKRVAVTRRLQWKLGELYRRDPEVRRAIDAAIAAHAGPEGARRWKPLLAAQSYRLAHWKTGNAEVNYRRFFSINELAALRQEDPVVFATTHARIFDLVRIGRRMGVTVNLRIDHPDGLADPAGLLGAMREKLSEANPSSHIWVESILGKEQSLPDSWPVSGTTGYDFMNQLGRATISAAGFRRIENWYRQDILAKPGSSFAKAVTAGKRQMLRSELSPDVRFLVERLERLAPDDEVSRADLRDAVIDAIIAMPVYRSYLVGDGGPDTIDAELLDKALRSIPARSPGHGRAVSLVSRLLLKPASGDQARRASRGEFVTRFQQLSAATMAKGLEDTAHYRDYALASLNEVGGSPEELTDSAIDEFHRAAQQRDARAMLAGTTHDTKRSADARTRLSVLTWMPEVWISTANRWRTANRAIRGSVDPNTEYLAYQTLIALWPRTRGRPDAAELDALSTRVTDYMIKAAREAKRKTRWSKPDEVFERDLRAFIHRMFDDGAARQAGHTGPRFLNEVASLVERIDRPAIWSSLSRTVVHYTAPGTADTYQGDELWNFVAVDPDNRRPVDFERRARLLADVETYDRASDPKRAEFVQNLLRHPENDRVKMHVVRRALKARNIRPRLFAQGSYVPLQVTGEGPPVLAFARVLGKQIAITVAPQGPGAGGDGLPTGAETWKDATIEIPPALDGARVTDQLTGQKITLASGRTRVSDLLGSFPTALLVGDTQ